MAQELMQYEYAPVVADSAIEVRRDVVADGCRR